MKWYRYLPTLLLTLALLLGCHSVRKKEQIIDISVPPTPAPVAMGATYMQPHDALLDEPPMADPFGPEYISDYSQIAHLPITLAECLTSAMSSSAVMRDLGVAIVRSPNSMVTEFDPAATYADPRFGEEAALSAFDANFVIRTTGLKNDRANNNRFLGNAEGLFAQDLMQHAVEINKVAATGTRFAVRHGMDYDFNNQAGNRWGPESKSWLTFLESEFRHPLLQGGGLNFNRIAGPDSVPGFYNGVLIARANTEIGLTRFEQGVRDLVSNVENAYWDLYFAYRDLEAAIAARDEAETFYREAMERLGEGSIQAISAREQVLRFETAIINALEGQLTDGTRTDGGSAGGSFRGSGGVRLAERRLRYLIGVSHTDGKLLLPSDEPTYARVVFDWDQAVDEALAQRPELRQQSWVVKQRQLELTAARNFLMPRLDLIALYRFRGLGNSLLGNSNGFMSDVNDPDPNSRNSTAFGDLLTGDFQEWQVGAELAVPLGFRQAHTAVRAAELRLQREKVVLREQHRAVSLALANAIGEVRRSYAAMDKSGQRFEAATRYKESARQLVLDGQLNADVLLEADRRMLESRQQFIRAQAEYMIALKNVHFEKGTLLRYNSVFLNEGESSSLAQNAAMQRFQIQGGSRPLAQQSPAIALGEGQGSPHQWLPQDGPVAVPWQGSGMVDETQLAPE